METIELVTLGMLRQGLLAAALLGTLAGALYTYWRGFQDRRPASGLRCQQPGPVLADRLEQICRAHTCAEGAPADIAGRLETVCRVHTVKR
ncbi:MAG TPA: hypothetical protein VFS21_39455 [Roseiflexaceae bacterium]|nr:hypothetical protein [Roseiflexaceae bacterium]